MSRDLSFIYKLIPTVQHYDWGANGEDSFLKNFIKKNYNFLLNEKPTAELWMGAHQKSPSFVISESNKLEENLYTLIRRNPEHFLGKHILNRNKNLPFLFKILDIAKPLSVQAHPNKELAEVLHRKNPQLYPDDNHKPELAICLSDFEALVGFRKKEEILQLYLNTPLKQLGDVDFSSEFTKEIYSKIMLSNSKTIQMIVSQFLKVIDLKPIDPIRDVWFKKLVYIFGDEDPGVFSIYLFNHYRLKQGEAIFLEPHIPHVYLQGIVLECMADSDNVVRGGLTSKYKDIEVLLSMLNYDKNQISIQKPILSYEGFSYYNLEIEDFCVLSFSNLYKQEISLNHFPLILLILDGSLEFRFRKDDFFVKKFGRSGEIFFLPGDLSDREIQVVLKLNENSSIYAATVGKSS